jgi:uncharacterized protein YndB with AHSA1/START domain
MKMRNIRQSITIKATPQDVYEALMDSRKHSRFTGARARMSRKIGGRKSECRIESITVSTRAGVIIIGNR